MLPSTLSLSRCVLPDLGGIRGNVDGGVHRLMIFQNWI
jgi:hypothetical protein